MQKHVTIVAALHIGFGILGLLLAGIVFVAVAGGGLLSGDWEAIAVTSTVATAIAFFFVVFSVPGIIGGFGLLNYRPWARVLIFIVSIIDLLNLPFGTIVGAYSIWVLVQDETIALFDQKTATPQTGTVDPAAETSA